MTTRDPDDPKGLISEAYRIDGITLAECRTIFLDWALGQPADMQIATTVSILLSRYASEDKRHPMTQTLNEALIEAPAARRRGGRAGRMRSDAID